MRQKISTQQLGVAILFFGIVLRLIVFWQNRSLFIDESSLSRNIVEKNFLGFFTVLDYDQYAPPLFLCISKLCTLLWGANEFALRAWPLAAGCLSLCLLLGIAKQVQLTGLAYLVPISWMTLSVVFVRYSTEVKQYSSDAMISLFLVYLILRSGLHQSAVGSIYKKPQFFYGIWGLVGSIVPWLSMPSVFLLFGIGCFVGWRAWREKAWSVLSKWSMVLGSWLLSFGYYYLLILQSDLNKDVLVDYHSQFFFPTNLFQVGAWEQIGFLLKSILRSTFGFTFLAYLFGSIGLILGVIVLARRSQALLMIIGLPILSCWIASAFGYYSLIPRLTLFFIPLLYLIFAFAFQEWQEKVLSIRGKTISYSYVLAIPLLLLLPVQKGYKYFWEPLSIEEIRPVLARLDLETGEASVPIYVDHEAMPAYLFYQGLHEDGPFLKNIEAFIASWDDQPADWVQTLAPDQHEVWLIYNHLISQYSTEIMLKELAEMPENWEQTEILREEGALAVQYLRKESPALTNPVDSLKIR